MTSLWRNVAEHDASGCAKHVANAERDRDFGPLDLGGRIITHLADAFLHGVHSLHTGVHVRQSTTVGVHRERPTRSSVAFSHDVACFSAFAEAKVFQ